MKYGSKIIVWMVLVLPGVCGMSQVIGGQKLESNPEITNSMNIIAYNVFLRPNQDAFDNFLVDNFITDKLSDLGEAITSVDIKEDWFLLNDQEQRAKVIPSKLRSYDVIVFSEVFDDETRNKMLSDMRSEYPYHTDILGTDRGIEQDGGVIIVSRWPIVSQGQLRFGDTCYKEDCLADKGVLYAKLKKYGFYYHIFGSHVQAGDGGGRSSTRQAQFKLINDFIESKNIPASEPVFIAGDLNVDLYNKQEFSQMLGLLNAKVTQLLGYRYTADSRENVYANGQKYLDYILVSNAHLEPISAKVETIVLKSNTKIGKGYDLSDHFPVYGHFLLPSTAQAIVANWWL